MDPISSADRLALILRQKLLARVRTDRTRSKPSATTPRGDAAAAIQALASADDVSDEALGRAFIQNILVDELGDELINQAQFQHVVDQVTDAIAGDQQGSKLLTRVLAELRSTARG